MNPKKISTLLLSTLCGFSIAIVPAQAETVTLNITKITCKDMLLMGGEERDSTLVFFHGLMMGKMNGTVLDSKKIAGQTDKILNHCVNNPQDKLMSVFAKAYR